VNPVAICSKAASQLEPFFPVIAHPCSPVESAKNRTQLYLNYAMEKLWESPP
jgi:hypothetical protein